MDPNGLHRNVEELEEYARLEGDLEPRFCEWAYESLARRSLVTDLPRSSLRATDIRKLALSHHPCQKKVQGAGTIRFKL